MPENLEMTHSRLFFLTWALTALMTGSIWAASPVPGDNGYAGRKGATIYVSKLGDNSDGSSWAKAFHSVQDGLDAVPDDRGGNRVIVRPDHYWEPNLSVPFKGAAGSYNLLVGDIDGSFGSGAQGWVVLDAGDEELGFKSWDWWGSIRASTKNWSHGNNKQNFSSIVWDRWKLKNLYTCGGDAGLFWDLTHESGKGFTVLVEDCVGTGRAFGGGLCYPVVRPEEPSLFRRCYFLALDGVGAGDTCAVLLGGWEKKTPEYPHAVFENCTLVHPDNAVQSSYASKSARGKFKNCRMIVLNFTQPEMGRPSSGIICCEKIPLENLHVDLEDCILAGYRLFGPGDKPSSYTAKNCQAYVQFKQKVPPEFKRLGAWPIELFAAIAPPEVVDGKIQWRGLAAPSKQEK
jgi:hypothetical protein